MLIRLLLNILLIFTAPYFIPGVVVENLYIASIVALLWALLNITIKPILTILTLPIQILTLGLFTLVINAGIALFISSFVQGFHIEGFLSALLLSLALSAANTIVNLID